MSQPYSHDDRKQARQLVKRLEEFANKAEVMARGKIAFNEDFVAGLTALTDTSDLEAQHRALMDMADFRRKMHMDALIDIAPNDLTAFAEVMSPNEPPAPHHIFVCDRMMEIERGDRDRMILSMPPGHAKDLDVDTPVMLGNGAWKRLGDIEVGESVITMHGRPREVLAVHDQGVRPVLKIVTASGRIVRAHPDHLFLTPSDWTAAKDLEVGTILAMPKEYEIAGEKHRSTDEFALAGYMMARAVVTGRTYSRFLRITNKFRCDDPAILADIKAICDRLGFSYRQTRDTPYGREAIALQFCNRFRDWLAEMDLLDVEKTDARVPEWVFRGTADRIGAFVGAICSCDATFRPIPNKQSGKQRVVSLTVKENAPLAHDLARLLQRLGIKAGHHHAPRLENYEPTNFTRIDIRDGVDQATFARRVPITGTSRRFWSLPIRVEHFVNSVYHSDPIVSIEPDGDCETRCITVEQDHSFIANGLVVHNSTYGSRYYPAWYLGRRENRIYLQAGHTKPFAEKEFGRKTRDLIDTDAFRKVFPEVRLRHDAKASADWYLTNGNRYVAKGVREAVSGFRSTNNGIDDPYPTFKDAQSPVYRNMVWDWFANDFMSRLLPQGNAFVISTRWHIDDVIGRIQELVLAGEMQPWDYINLPVFCTDPETDQMNRPLGEALWPDFYTKEVLLRQKALMSSSQWCALYDGNPVPADGNVIKAAWLTTRWAVPPLTRVGSLVGNQQKEAGVPEIVGTGGQDSPTRIIESAPPYVRTVVSVDSAEKETNRADFSALTIWRETIDRRHYIVDAHRERMDFPKLLARVDEYAKLWNAEIVLMETKGAGNQFIQHIEALPADEAKPYTVVPIDPGRDGKVFRMDSVTPFFMAHRVILPERASWLPVFERELLQFPGSQNDDFADSVSQYLKWVREMSGSRRGTKKLR